jgi:hypothetical protein
MRKNLRRNHFHPDFLNTASVVGHLRVQPVPVGPGQVPNKEGFGQEYQISHGVGAWPQWIIRIRIRTGAFDSGFPWELSWSGMRQMCPIPWKTFPQLTSDHSHVLEPGLGMF